MRRLLLFSLLCLGCAARAQTFVSGSILSNTIFTAAKSPYIVAGSLTVYEHVALTIEPGVEIMVDSGQRIEIRGTLVAVGTAASPINVHGHNRSGHPLGYWTGFVLISNGTPNAPRASFNHCNVSNAVNCFDLDFAYGGPYYFRNCAFSYNTAVNYDGGLGGTFFDSCVITNNYFGLTHFGYGGKVTNSLFDSNVYAAEEVDSIVGCRFTNNTQIAAQPRRYMAGCEVYYNNVGVESSFSATNNTFIDNKVMNNTVGVRILSYANGSVRFTGNELCDNRQHNVVLATATNCDLSLNCWCVSDSASVRAKILDRYTDTTRGTASYVPFNRGCIPLTTATAGNTPGTGFLLSPNPLRAGASLHIRWQSGARRPRIYVHDATGRSIAYERMEEPDADRLSFPAIAPGMYSVTVAGEGSPACVQRFTVLE